MSSGSEASTGTAAHETLVDGDLGAGRKRRAPVQPPYLPRRNPRILLALRREAAPRRLTMMRLMVASVLTASTLLMACGGLEHVTEDELGASPSATLSFSGTGYTIGGTYFLKLEGSRTSGPACTGVGSTLNANVSPSLVNCASLGGFATAVSTPVSASVCQGGWTFSSIGIYDSSLCGGKIATCDPITTAVMVGPGTGASVALACHTLSSTVSFDPSLN